MILSKTKERAVVLLRNIQLKTYMRPHVNYNIYAKSINKAVRANFKHKIITHKLQHKQLLQIMITLTHKARHRLQTKQLKKIVKSSQKFKIKTKAITLIIEAQK